MDYINSNNISLHRLDDNDLSKPEYKKFIEEYDNSLMLTIGYFPRDSKRTKWIDFDGYTYSVCLTEKDNIVGLAGIHSINWITRFGTRWILMDREVEIAIRNTVSKIFNDYVFSELCLDRIIEVRLSNDDSINELKDFEGWKYIGEIQDGFLYKGNSYSLIIELLEKNAYLSNESDDIMPLW